VIKSQTRILRYEGIKTVQEDKSKDTMTWICYTQRKQRFLSVDTKLRCQINNEWGDERKDRDQMRYHI
jgi:hypothetical protein